MRHHEPRGFMSPAELKWLKEVAKYRPYIVEFGSWCGLSAWHAIQHAQKIWCVDSWDPAVIDTWAGGNTAKAQAVDAETEFLAALGHEIAQGLVVPVKVDLRSAEALPRIRAAMEPIGRASMVFIDAGHADPHPDLDIRLAMEIVGPMGIVAGHDYGRTEWPAVKEAAERHFPGKVHRGPHTIWWAEAREYVDA